LQRFSLKGAWNAQPKILHFNCPHCQQLYVEHRLIDYVHLIAFVIFILAFVLALPFIAPDWSEKKMDELGFLYLLIFFSLIAYLRGITRPLVSLRMKFNTNRGKNKQR